MCKSSRSCWSGKSNPKITELISLSQMRTHNSHSYGIQYVIYTVFSFVHTPNSHKKKVHRCPLTQQTRAHYRWQIFALELAASVYPAGLSTETEFGRGWKRTKRGSATNSIGSKATSLHSVTGCVVCKKKAFKKLFRLGLKNMAQQHTLMAWAV